MNKRTQQERPRRRRGIAAQPKPRAPRAAFSSLSLLALVDIAWLLGCALNPLGGGGQKAPGSTVAAVAVQPASASLFLGQTQQFQAIVTGASNSGVVWSVNGIAGGNSNIGSVGTTGVYAAPAILPATATVTVTAVSIADATVSASATVTLKDDIVVSVSPSSASLPAGSAQAFTATVTGSGSPATGVAWSINGILGGNATFGAIVATGNDGATYTAPVVPPASIGITVTATSVADATKSGSASVTITCANSISPSRASVSLGQTQTFASSLCVAPGTSITWDVNGIVGGNSVVGTITDSGPSGAAKAAVYTAPADMPAFNPVTIHASAGAAQASASVTLASSVNVSISLASASLSVSQRATFTADVTNTPDGAVTWSVNGVPNGNPAVGQICVVASNPCVSPNGAISGSVDYIAPAAVPAPDPVTLTATSRADHTRSGAAIVSVAGQTGQISVSVAPAYAFVPPSTSTSPSTLRFSAVVMGADQTDVIWSVQSGVAGQGCSGAACGSIDETGLYTAPSTAPSPNSIAVTATSVADSTKSATAIVAITTGPMIQVLLPSSVMAGAVESFPFEVQGANFIAGSGSSASTILLNGVPRNTTCATANACTTFLVPSDVQSAATLSVQIQNPGSPGQLSNVVPFVIVPFDVSVGTIPLSESQPAATSQNIVVVDPTTAAASSPIDVDFIGFLTDGNNCGVQGSPLTVTRPASGNETVSLCVHGNGLDPAFTYAFTGPNGGDIGVAASGITGIFPNMVELDLTISGATLPGVRSLFITTLNNDRAVATGMLEVK